MFLFMLLFGLAFGAEFTLPGECPNVKLHENLDYTKFSGVWYDVANYASDGRPIYDCASFDFQEDNLGYTLRETYVDWDQGSGNRTRMSYFARVDPTFDAGNKAQFIISYEDGDKVLQFPFYILSTDYDSYAIAYTLYTWILSRQKEILEGKSLKKVEDALAKYSELSSHRQSFEFKDFSELSCGYVIEYETDFFTPNFW